MRTVWVVYIVQSYNVVRPVCFLADKFWAKKLRACCLCGLLKTEEMCVTLPYFA